MMHGRRTAILVGGFLLAALAYDCARADCPPAPASIPFGGDTITLAERGVSTYVLCYSNNIAQASDHGAWSISLGDLVVTGSVLVGVAETITVHPPEGYAVFPADPQEVMDGARVEIVLYQGVM